MKLHLLIFSGLLCGCQKQRPHFEEVSSKQLQERYEPNNGDFIDTIVKTKDYEFYYLADAHHWEGDNFYYLRRGNKLFKLEPDEEVGNGVKALHVLNDSTLLFYTQFYNRPFGDFWIIKNGTDLELRLDSGIIYNTERYNLKYKNGRLVAIGDNEVMIDSVMQKQLRNTLYRLKLGALVPVGKYDALKDDIESLDDGIYYFSFPGRYISDTLTLTK